MFTYKFRLIPNDFQTSLLWKHANTLNFFYNFFLSEKISNFQSNKTSISKSQQNKQLTKLRNQNINNLSELQLSKSKILEQIHSQVCQQVTLRLDNSYNNFFNKIKKGTQKPGFPKYRSCHKFFGIKYPQQGYKLTSRHFYTKNYGPIPFKKTRKILGNIKQVSITTHNNQWFICITTDSDFKSVYGFEKSKPLSPPKDDVGIDLGIKNLLRLSDRTSIIIDGKKVTTYNIANYYDKSIAIIKEKQSKCKKGSRRYKYLAKTINNLYDKKTKRIDDFLHKITYQLATKYNYIYIEDLDVKELGETEISNVNRVWHNIKLGKFISLLKQKVNNVIEVNAYNTSRTCNKCGYVHKDLKLSDREFECDGCGEMLDRDDNASDNIELLGRYIRNDGGSIRTTINEVLLNKADNKTYLYDARNGPSSRSKEREDELMTLKREVRKLHKVDSSKGIPYL